MHVKRVHTCNDLQHAEFRSSYKILHSAVKFFRILTTARTVQNDTVDDTKVWEFLLQQKQLHWNVDLMDKLVD